ncbi:MAG: hypothetical protein ACKV2T_11535 [Kofleriaceae bacterium]
MRSLFLLIAIGAAFSRPAAADAPSIDAVKAAATDFYSKVFDADGKPLDKAQLAKFGAPFWYDGNAYFDTNESAAKACKKSFGAKGTVKDAAKIEAYVNCFRFAMFGGALDGDAEWSEANLKKLPKVFKKHAAKLKKVAKDRRIAISHFMPAGPAEYWALYVAHDEGGKVVFDAWLLVNLEFEP